MKKRNVDIDTLKGVLIIIVVLRHVFQRAAGDTTTDYLSNMMAVIEMPLFIMISGYFGASSIYSNYISFKELKIKLIKKTKTYLIPFLSYFIVFRVIYMKSFALLYGLKELSCNITLSLWYLFVIWVLSIILNVAVFIAVKINQRKIYTWFVMIFVYFAFLMLFASIGLLCSFNFLGVKLVLYYSMFYLLGYHFRYFLNADMIIGNNLLSALCFVVYMLGSRYFYVLEVPDTLVYIIIRYFLALAGSVTLIRVVKLISDSWKKKLSFIGENTLEIYYIHSVLVSTVSVNIANNLMSFNGLLNSFLISIYLLIFVPSIIFLIRSNYIIELVIFGKDKK